MMLQLHYVIFGTVELTMVISSAPGLGQMRLAKKDGLALELTEAQVKPFVGTDFVSGNSWILALPPP
jgi:hypothetical protein